MTSRDLFRLLVRRWYLVLVGAAIALAVAATVSKPAGIYWTQFNVVLLPPTYEEFPNEFEDSPYSLAPLAGVVVAQYNGIDPSLLTSSSDTTIYGMGERSGVMVRMPNQGNQWIPIYSSPNIDVQVSDSTPEQVATQAKETIADLQQILTELQASLGIAPSARVTMIASAADPAIVHVSGSRVRALGAIGIVGAATTIASIYWLERLVLRRRTKHDSGRLRAVGPG